MRALFASLQLLFLSGCAVVAQLPVIRPDTPNFVHSPPGAPLPNTLTATITQNNGPLAAGLVVTCLVSFDMPPGQNATVTALPATSSDRTNFTCTFPPNRAMAIRKNHVLVFEWVVDTTDEAGNPLTIGRSPLARFQVGCDGADAVSSLSAMQGAVLSKFPPVMTFQQIIGLGYLPTHPLWISTPVATPAGPVPAPVMAQRVFLGMGVAFARAIDVPTVGGFVPSLPLAADSPNLLLFVPSATIAGDPSVADPLATYTLVGWAYATNLVSQPVNRPPIFECIPLHEWFFHEAGMHMPDGGFSPGIGSALGVPHARVWDVHVWIGSGGLPRLGILNVAGGGGSVTPGSGFSAPAGSFFYPQFAPP